MGTACTSPPNSSRSTPASFSANLVASTSAPGRSILLSATSIGVSAPLIMRIDSSVCSRTPSDESTTSTTMSVVRAPRDRIALKAAWPGVSMNVTSFELSSLRKEQQHSSKSAAPSHISRTT